ncbi:hypothetical protein BDZ90DRAFT_231359 [Jaminaea rosea]|uniref:Uncharacterized protein n=1 Tax=Jaminaea rosea TaxID=1569628 RepID=A0A316UST9_9BASI|nr:hypothetical protein BDZ90DRAFT_231359 [Jaminaea rosea]PWN28366.1 hypothetical protein BDZ90DRAFT_231359 [Jaminaea rosea]
MSRRRGAQTALEYACGSAAQRPPGPSIPHTHAYSLATAAPPSTSKVRIPASPSYDLFYLAALSSLSRLGGARRSQSTRRVQTSNLELHPTPIDYSIFEDPGEDSYTAKAAEVQDPSSSSTPASLAAYAAPSPSQVVEGILRSDGSSFITDAKLTEATATLRQFEALHGSDGASSSSSGSMGTPSHLYLDAAYVAFTKGRPADALHWIRCGPPYSNHAQEQELTDPQLKSSHQAVSKILLLLSERATRNPAPLRQALIVLVAKGWHASADIGKRMILALKDALHVLPVERGQARKLCTQMTAADNDRRAQLDAKSLSPEVEQKCREFLTQALNAIVRHLTLVGRYEEAIEMVDESIAIGTAQNTVTPDLPIRGFTYKLFVRRLIDSGVTENVFAAYRIQAALQQLAEELGNAGDAVLEQPQASTPASQRPTRWSSRQASRLFEEGSQLLNAAPMDPTQLASSFTSSKHEQLKGYHSEEAIFSDLEAGRIGRARRLMMSNLRKGRRTYWRASGGHQSTQKLSEFAHLPSARLLARYQEASLAAQASAASSTSSASAAADSSPPRSAWLCEDVDFESALDASRGGKCLWQTAHLYRLYRSRHLIEALRYYRATCHPTPDLPEELFEIALQSQQPDAADERPPAPADRKLLWPSWHAANLTLRCIVDLIRAPASGKASERDHPEERRVLIDATLQRLQRAYETWRESVAREALQAQRVSRRERVHEMVRKGSWEPSMSGRQVDSYSFDPWLSALAAERHKLDGVTLWRSQENRSHLKDADAPVAEDHSRPPWPTRDAASEVGALRIFDGMAKRQMLVSTASHRALRVLEDMQDLGVEPSIATYTILLDTLGRDAGASYAGDSNAAWQLVLHLAQKLGLAPPAKGGAAEARTATGLPSATLPTYSALLHSLLSRVPEQRRRSRATVKAGAADTASTPPHLEKALIVQGWLAEAVQRASEALTTEERDAGNETATTGSSSLCAIPQADVAANQRVMALLRSVAEAVEQAEQREARDYEEGDADVLLQSDRRNEEVDVNGEWEAQEHRRHQEQEEFDEGAYYHWDDARSDHRYDSERRW